VRPGHDLPDELWQQIIDAIAENAAGAGGQALDVQAFDV
jgi:hypothetical protein